MKPLFKDHGVHVLVDGQFGSTGKGALAAYLASEAFKDVENGGPPFMGVITNAGPNSGHTFYHGSEKIVLKQLPTFAVATYLAGRPEDAPWVYFDGGAIIDPEILFKEAKHMARGRIYINPQAVVVQPEDAVAEGSGTVQAVAGTRSGAGAALARKVLRDPTAVANNYYKANPAMLPPNAYLYVPIIEWDQLRYFMEVSQGFSLGIHSDFYPKVTSRECTVSQGLADARLPPQSIAETYMVVRTYPIRVGNHEGFSSGDWYEDQMETSWEAIGQTPELTTVTQRVRRIATFSVDQFIEACQANCPTFVLVNFLNYLNPGVAAQFIDQIRGVLPADVDMLLGYGPKVHEIRRLEE